MLKRRMGLGREVVAEDIVDWGMKRRLNECGMVVKTFEA